MIGVDIATINKGGAQMIQANLPRAAAGLLAAAIILTGALPSRPARAADKEPLTAAEFERLHRKLTRMGTEKVWSVPWHVSVREAREQAAKENKPILLWCSNNGGTNPLGPC